MQQLLESISEPNTRHAMLVHFPIAMGTLSIVLLAAFALGAFRNSTLRWTVVAWCLAVSLGLWLAAGAGRDAAAAIRASEPLPGPEQLRALDLHEVRGARAWLWPLVPGVLAALTHRRGPRARVALGAGATVAAVGVAAWIGFVGHVGGRLVYVHGLGVPARATLTDPAPSRAEAAVPDSSPDSRP